MGLRNIQKNLPTLAIDFDGTICEYTGWKGIFHIGEIKPEAENTIKELAKEYVLILHTTRLNSHLTKDIDSCYAQIMSWLVKHDIADCFSIITGEKPIADIYIDDRAYRFKNWEETYWEVKDLLKGK